MDARTSRSGRPQRLGALARLRGHFRRGCDEGSASMASYVVAAAIFIMGTSYLVQFAIEPPGSGTSNLEHIGLKSVGQQALEVLLGTPGMPPTWANDATTIEATQRLGLLEPGSSIRINASKFDALARGKYETTSNANGAIDYGQAKEMLGLDGYEFHLSAHPVVRAAVGTEYGVVDMEDFDVAYVGRISGGAWSVSAQYEADALDNLPIAFTNKTRSADPLGDVFMDQSTHLRQHLLPSLGATIQQEVISNGAGTKYDFYRVDQSVYEGFLTLNATNPQSAPLTDAMALSSEGHTLGYSKNRELRAILGSANLTGTSGAGALATIHWHEWVDTDRGNGTTDCGDYGYVEVSGDGGASWVRLTDTAALRSQDCAPLAPQVPQLEGASAPILGASCAACINNAEVLIGFHWVADNDDKTGYGWVVDNMQVVNATDGKILSRKTFESPEYDLLVIGSDVDHAAFVAEEVKSGIRDYVDKYGGRLMVLGGQSNVQWLDRLFDAAVGGSSGGVAAPDNTHPILTLPNSLSYTGYKPYTPWDFSASDDAGLFHTITGDDELHPQLTVSRQGAWGAGGASEGAVILSSYKPGEWGKDETKRFFANTLVYGKYHYLYLDVGPKVPDSEAVASVSRSATMDKHRTGEPAYIEMAFVLYVWPGESAAQTLAGTSVQAMPPRAITAQAANNSVWVNWTWPLSNGTGDAQAYEVWRGNGPGGATTRVKSIPVAGFNWTFYDHNVTNGTAYWYNVTLQTSAGRGSPSAEVGAVPVGLATAPRDVTTQSLATTIRVEWQPPAWTGPGTIYGYAVWGKRTTDATYVLVAELGNVTSYTHAPPDGAAWMYTVSAINARGYGPNSTASAPGQAISPAGAPELRVTNATLGALTLSWDPPAIGGDDVQRYHIDRSEDGATWARLAESETAVNVSFIDAEVADNASYWYRVAAETSVGDGEWSDEVEAKTLGAPWKIGPLAKTGSINGVSMSFSWEVPNDAGASISSYVVYRGLTAADQDMTFAGVAGTNAYTDLDAGSTSYYYKVSASNAVGSGEFSDPMQLPMTASAPTLTLLNTTAGRLVASWTTPADFGHDEPSTPEYRLERSADAGQTWSQLPDAGTLLTNLSWDDRDVAANASYSYRVRAVTSAGDGAAATKTGKTLGAPWTVTGLARTDGVADVSVMLGWNAANDAGSPVTNYTICWGDVAGQEDDCAAAIGTSYTHLTGQVHHYVVRATNAIGTGPDSAWVQAKNAPGAPAVTLSNAIAGRIYVNWSAPNMGGGSFVGYTIYRSDDGSTWYQLATGAVANRTWSDQNVSANTTYHYRVAETNEVGQGANSTDAYRTTAGVPWPPTISLTWNPLLKQVVLTWAAPNNGGSAITGYEVWRGSSSGGQTLYVSGAISPWAETVGAGQYYYKVRAINAVGAGNFSNEVSVSA